MKQITQEERDAFSNYIYQAAMRPPSTEGSLYATFQFLLRARAGLECPHLLPDLPCPVIIMYGDRDWMRLDMEGAYRAKIRRDQKHYYTRIHFVENSGHHIYMDNPAELVMTTLLEVDHECDKLEIERESLEFYHRIVVSRL